MGPFGSQTQHLPLDIPKGVGNALAVRVSFSETPNLAEIVVSLSELPVHVSAARFGLSASDDGLWRVELVQIPGDAITYSGEFIIPPGAIVLAITLACTQGFDPVDLAVQRLLRSSLGEDVLVNITVDTEALPGRTDTDHLNRLVFGRFPEGEFGLPLHLELLRSTGTAATFYLEVAQSSLWGDRGLSLAAEMVRSAGHDIQLHLHSDIIFRALKRPVTSGRVPHLCNLDLEETRFALHFAMEKFSSIVGTSPLCLRGGGYLFNQHTISVAKEVGLAALSNFRTDQQDYNPYTFRNASPTAPFLWTNGLCELTITLSPEPLTARTASENWARIADHVISNGATIINVVVHSWSFLSRGEDGFHRWTGWQLYERMKEFIELTPSGIRYATASEAIEFIRSGRARIGASQDPQALIAQRPF